jgi:sugar/nucleoside kinase (ribokinase family)
LPRLLVLGHATRDELDGEPRLGGAVSYAALAAAQAGVPTALVTAAPPRDALLAPLLASPRLELRCVKSEVMTTFGLTYEGGRRTLRLERRAPSLRPADVPSAWRRAEVAYVAPVAGECDRALVESIEGEFVGVGLQGWLRRAGGDGRIEPALLPEAKLPPRVQVAIASEEDHPEIEAVAARFVAAGAVVAITRGARGATIREGGRRIEIPAVPAREVDPTGAGDVFGVVLTLRLAEGQCLAEAGHAAAAAAAAVVGGVGVAPVVRASRGRSR